MYVPCKYNKIDRSAAPRSFKKNADTSVLLFLELLAYPAGHTSSSSYSGTHPGERYTHTLG